MQSATSSSQSELLLQLLFGRESSESLTAEMVQDGKHSQQAVSSAVSFIR
jgi:hypothetical protein